MSEVQNSNESSSDQFQWPEKQSTPKKPEQEPPGRVSGDFSKQK